MPLYRISYDISEKDAAKYGSLWNFLEGITAVKILDSEWVVARGSIDEEKSLHDQIVPLMRPSDRLIVQELLNTVEWTNIFNADRFAELLRSARSINPFR